MWPDGYLNIMALTTEQICPISSNLFTLFPGLQTSRWFHRLNGEKRRRRREKSFSIGQNFLGKRGTIKLGSTNCQNFSRLEIVVAVIVLVVAIVWIAKNWKYSKYLARVNIDIENINLWAEIKWSKAPLERSIVLAKVVIEKWTSGLLYRLVQSNSSVTNLWSY